MFSLPWNEPYTYTGSGSSSTEVTLSHHRVYSRPEWSNLALVRAFLCCRQKCTGLEQEDERVADVSCQTICIGKSGGLSLYNKNHRSLNRCRRNEKLQDAKWDRDKRNTNCSFLSKMEISDVIKKWLQIECVLLSAGQVLVTLKITTDHDISL